jgi:hypothetical protein
MRVQVGVGAVASVGPTGDSNDNTLAEAFNSLFKAKLIRNKGPWRSIDDLEIAVASVTSTGSITGACTARTGSYPLPSTKTPTIVTTPLQRPPKRYYRASTEQ